MGLAWLKFAVAALLSTVVIDFQEKSHGYAYSGNYSQIKVSRVLSCAPEKYVQKRKFLTAAFLSLLFKNDHVCTKYIGIAKVFQIFFW